MPVVSVQSTERIADGERVLTDAQIRTVAERQWRRQAGEVHLQHRDCRLFIGQQRTSSHHGPWRQSGNHRLGTRGTGEGAHAHRPQCG